MRLRVNLRSDLRKLSDDDLAERLEAAWRVVDARSGPVTQWRGPLRHPRIYRLLSFFGAATIAFAIAGTGIAPWNVGTANEYLAVCEIRDIMDEIERRLAQRKATKP